MSSCGYQVSIRSQAPHAVARQELAVPAGEKEVLLRKINQGDFLIKFRPAKESWQREASLALLGEYRQFTFDITNNSQKTQEINIDAMLPSGWPFRLYRQALLNDWYSANPRKDGISFYGDALIPLGGDKIKLLEGETARILLDFTAQTAGNHRAGLMVTGAGKRQVFTSDLEVKATPLPAVNFPSILFNANNYQSGKEFVAIGQRAGLTHLQVNYIPEVTFNAKGRPVSGINSGAIGSTGFRNTALPWLKAGGHVCLFWQPRYAKLAPMGKESFIDPLTPAWEQAFVELLKLVKDDVARRCPECPKDAIVLYLADEFSASTKKDNNERAYLNLVKRIKREVPEIPILVTFGFYTSPAEVKNFSAATDINALHFSLPKTISRKNRSFEPVQLRSAREKTGFGGTNWAYQIGKGKTTDVREFLVYPMQAALLGEKGFSWWAFAAHQGSCWIANDGKLPDYSLIYTAETGNPVYEAWRGAGDDSYLPSMRLLATRAGLDDASIINWLSDQQRKFSRSEQQEFLRIRRTITTATVNKDSRNPEVQLSLTAIEKLRNDLRRLYAAVRLQ